MFEVMSKEDKQLLFESAVIDITAGRIVNIVDASGASNSVCIGDFRDIGWSTRVTTSNSLCYAWDGPNPIRVNGKIVNPGETTEEVDMDWS